MIVTSVKRFIVWYKPINQNIGIANNVGATIRIVLISFDNVISPKKRFKVSQAENIHKIISIIIMRARLE